MSAKYTVAKVLAGFSLAAILVVAGCSSDNGNGPKPYDVEENLNRAWGYFAAGDYDQGLSVFDDVLTHSEDNPEALMGKGWCFAFKEEYDSAISSFDSANDNELATADAWMGLTVVYRDYPDYDAGLSSGEQVVAIDSLYQFAERTTIDYKDARLIRAECAYHLGRSYFPVAHEEINYLCDILGLTPLPDPGSMAGETYEILMVDKLEDLSDLISD